MGNVLVITGPSGVGKGTLIRGLRERLAGLELSVSATTRRPRPGEVAGREYHFLTEEGFQGLIDRGELLEHAEYAGHRYGTPRAELERPAELGLVLEIELEGARQVRRALPEAVQVFVAPPSLDALRSRLVGRGLDSQEQIESRLERAAEELKAREEFEHVVVNDRLESAVDELARLIGTMWGT